MTLTYFIIGLVVVIIVGLIAELLLYRMQNHASGDGPLLMRAYNIANGWFGQVRERTDQLLTPDYLPTVAEFKAWAEHNLDDEPRLRDWLLSLPDEGLKALVSQLAQYCQELSINLNWLIRGDLRDEGKLEESVKQVVVDYCAGCLKAVQIQTELAEFSQYEQTLMRLAQRRNRVTAQRLMERLHDHELAPPVNSDLLLASEDERYAYVLETLKESSKQDRETFNRLVAEVQQTQVQPAQPAAAERAS